MCSLLSTPSVTIRQGQKANIDVVREFPYPISFVAGKAVLDPKGKGLSNLPPTPREFATKSVGVSLEITPTIGTEDTSARGKIALNGKLTVTTFDRFTKSNVEPTGMPSFTTSESLFMEALNDRELKGVWVPGEHVSAEGTQIPNGQNGSSGELVKKRYLLFVSAKLEK